MPYSTDTGTTPCDPPRFCSEHGTRDVFEISQGFSTAHNAGVTRRSMWESMTMGATYRTDHTFRIHLLDGSVKTVEAITAAQRQELADAATNVPYTTQRLYSCYVGWGYADSDGWYVPFTFDYFSKLDRATQLSMAEIPATDPRA